MSLSIEQSALRKITRRLIPFLALLYFVSFLDRVNVGFAALTMNRELGLSPLLFGWGAGIFFLGYFLFEVPSNIALERVGARRWIARIMVSWGILSAGNAFVTGPAGFLLVRFLLGIAEAGFFPGMVLYLTYWVPAQHRAKMIASFMSAIPISSALGAPVSGALLGLDGIGGLSGWQWLFILEGLPAVILGIVVLFYLADRPSDAAWLTAAERDWLVGRLAGEEQHRLRRRRHSLAQALLDRRVVMLGLVYFGMVTGLYGIGFWMPQIVKGFGLSNLAVGFVVAIPYVAAAAAMVPWGRHSDRTGERVRHLAVAALVGGVGLAASGYVANPVPAMLALTAAAVGIYCIPAVFWTMPTAYLSGTAAAGGIALINSIGNLGGFAGPYLIGWAKDASGGYSLGLSLLAGFVLMAGVVALALGHDRSLEIAQDTSETPHGRGE